jgi:starvation-inducible outer membrane lipoprotein
MSFDEFNIELLDRPIKANLARRDLDLGSTGRVVARVWSHRRLLGHYANSFPM